MEHNSVVSGYPNSIGISWVDVLSTGPSGFGTSHDIYIYSRVRVGSGYSNHWPKPNPKLYRCDKTEPKPNQNYQKKKKKKKVVPKPTQTSGWA